MITHIFPWKESSMVSRRNTTWMYRNYRRYGFKPSTLLFLCAITSFGFLVLFYRENSSYQDNSLEILSEPEISTSISKSYLDNPQDKFKHHTSDAKPENKAILTETQPPQKPERKDAAPILPQNTKHESQQDPPKEQSMALKQQQQEPVNHQDAQQKLNEKFLSYAFAIMQKFASVGEDEQPLPSYNDDRPAFQDTMEDGQTFTKNEPVQKQETHQNDAKTGEEKAELKDVKKSSKTPPRNLDPIPHDSNALKEARKPSSNSKSPLADSLKMLLPMITNGASSGSKDGMSKMILSLASNALPAFLEQDTQSRGGSPLVDLATKVGPMLLGSLISPGGGQRHSTDQNNPSHSLSKVQREPGQQGKSKPADNGEKSLVHPDRASKKQDGVAGGANGKEEASNVNVLSRQPLSVEEEKAKTFAKIQSTGEANLEIHPMVKNVGSFVFRNILNSLPESFKVPESHSDSIWDIAFRSAIGDLRDPSQKNTLLMRTLRGMSGNDVTEKNIAPSWISEALKNPERRKKESVIRSLFEVLSGNETNNAIAPPCANVLPFGGKFHWKSNEMVGSQLLCEDQDFRSGSEACRIYSFSSHEDLSFEESMAKRGCRVWLFGSPSPQESQPRRTMHFMNFSLGYKDEKVQRQKGIKQFFTLETIMKKLKHTSSQINYLKLDLHGEEWKILWQLTSETPFILNRINQWGIVVHLHQAMKDPDLYEQHLNLLRQLPPLGFQIFASRMEKTNSHDLYAEPFLNNRTASLTNYIAYMRI